VNGNHDQAMAQKQVIIKWAERAGRPDRWEDFAPGFRWRMIGTTPVSGTMIGVAGVDEQMAGFRRRLKRMTVVIDSLICEGDTVVKIAHSDGLTVDGRPYRNELATVFRFTDGLVVEVIEFLDTALIETVIFEKDLVAGTA
jgi:ketosteroid isomerase-like protein